MMTDKEILEFIIRKIRFKYKDTLVPQQKEDIKSKAIRINIKSAPYTPGNTINKIEAVTEVTLTINMYGKNVYECLEMSEAVKKIMHELRFERSAQSESGKDSTMNLFKQTEIYKAVKSSIRKED